MSTVLLVDLEKTDKHTPRNIKKIFLTLFKLKEIQVTEGIIEKYLRVILTFLWEDHFISTANLLYFQADCIPPQIWVLAKKQAVNSRKFTLTRGPKPKSLSSRG